MTCHAVLVGDFSVLCLYRAWEQIVLDVVLASLFVHKDGYRFMKVGSIAQNTIRTMDSVSVGE